MDRFFYIVISQSFAEQMQGRESPINPESFFGYTITCDGRRVCSSNSVKEFPEDFASLGGYEIVELFSEDFPPTPPISTDEK